MFCPECGAEYRPEFIRCADCNVPLVEHLIITRGNPEPPRVSGWLLFKEWGWFIVLLPTLVATVLVIVALNHNPFEVQIATVIMYTGSLIFFVFCDAGPGKAIGGKGTKGFSLAEGAIRRKLPLLTQMHAGALIILFAAVTGAIRLRPRAWSLWHLDPGYFDVILLFTGVALLFAQVHFFRRLLARALEDE